MGLILDSSVLIACERQGEGLDQLVQRLQARLGDTTNVALSAICAYELTHGIYRAATALQRERRKYFVDAVCRDMVVHPVTLDVARLAGRIEAQQATRGITIAVEDLLIGATALHLGMSVCTLNVRHFEKMPGLHVVTV